MKRLARAALTFAPGLQDHRFAVQRAWLQVTRRPADSDLALLRRLSFPLDALLLDIGANRGLTLQTMRMLLPAHPVEAFEPNPNLAEHLRRAWRHDPAVTVHAVALGKTRHTLTLFVPTYRGYPFDGLASLDEDKAMGWLDGRRIAGFNPALLGCQRHEVPVEPLDRFELAPAFIKIDVQGTEFAMLQGAVETLRRHAPILLIESPNPDEEGALLAELGYVGYSYRQGRLHANQFDGKNVFFLPQRAEEGIRSLLAA